jgi:peptidyl-prolyl cis-trans isomerase D
VNAAFSGPKGSAAVAGGTADQSKVVLLVTDVNLPPYFSGTPDLEQGEEQLTRAIADDMMQQYIGQLQSQLRVVLNQSAIEQAIGAAPGS